MKFLHTADWQIGKPFARISDPDKAARVRSERIEAIRRIGKLAASKNADFVLVAGDLFDSFTPEKSVVSAACSAIGEIGVPVLAIPGNHDHGGPGSLWEQDFFLNECESLAPNFRILLEREPIELEAAILFPCPLLRRHESTDPTEWLRHVEIDSNKPRIILAHGSVHGFDSESDGTPNLIALDRLPSDTFDYIALGDWHGTMQIDDRAWYPGTPEIDRFPKGDRNDPGNVLAVDIGRGSTPDVEKIFTGGLGWHTVDFDFASDNDVDRLAEELSEKIGTRAGQDLLLLSLRGSLGIAAATHLDELLETWQSRLLRVKESNAIRLSPSEEEIESLTRRAGDPLIANVAASLMTETEAGDESAEIARVALRELYAACAT